jgi:hypothetical protein
MGNIFIGMQSSLNKTLYKKLFHWKSMSKANDKFDKIQQQYSST